MYLYFKYLLLLHYKSTYLTLFYLLDDNILHYTIRVKALFTVY